MAMDSGLSIGDALALKGDNGGFLGGSTGGILALIIVFILLFGNGGLWGGNAVAAGYATQADIQRSFDTNEITSKLDSIANGICSSGYENAQLINGVNMNMMNGFAGVSAALNSGFDSVNQSITNLGYQMQQQCCDIKTQLLQDKYEAVVGQLETAQDAVANNIQTQNILNALGRYYTYPAVSPCSAYNGCGCGCM